MNIRLFVPSDTPGVLDIERSLSDSWSEDDVTSCFRRGDNVLMVAETRRVIVGFMAFQLRSTRLHLLRFAVHPTWRRRGVGLLLVSKLIGKLSANQRQRITVDVPERNLIAQLFLRCAGFRAEKVRRRFFEAEDGYAMVYRVESHVAASR